MATQTQVGMSMDDFVREYDRAPFELIDGQRMPLMPTVAGHGVILKRWFALLLDYERQSKLFSVFTELPYVLAYSSDWVTGSRVPDLMLFAASRLAEYIRDNSEWRERPFLLIPDLCIEIISPNDVYLEVDAKVQRYLADGVSQVWVVNPRQQTVTVHTAGSNRATRLTDADTLEGGDLLPDFALPVRKMFED